MNELYLIAGIIVLLGIVSDFFYTTVSFNGAGLLSKNISSGIANLFLWVQNKTKNRTIFRFSGLVHILAMVISWIGLLWGGLFLLLMSDLGSVIVPSTGLPATVLSKLYVSGFTLSTLGMGDYVPGSHIWEVVIAIFSFAGFIFLTTAMTYLMSLTTAVIHKRNLSLFISNMGDTPEELVAGFYDGERFSILSDISSNLREMINRHNQNHYAHPAVHYFYSIDREESLSINLVNVDEALTILTHHIESSTWRAQDIEPLRDAITRFLDTASHHYHQIPEEITNHSADIGYLKSKNIPLKQNQAMPSDSFEMRERRNSMHGLLRSNGWNWNDVYPN